ncbi:hypothetical protein SAMN06264849_11413 [Melghirimyces algeriensis]|uniref:Uncharacterized protein n=1 Tax=Melghirimyces algeriensis TaxID=910412 RepID=A0A521F7G1_9BACL|nr:hypothetical protein SAMN06264849_11413 [Melghirimyces algeriensis]
MPFDVFDASSSKKGRPSTNKIVSIDKNKRLYINKPLQMELGCVKIPVNLYVGYDKVNKRIGIAKPDVVRITDKSPIRFDARGYASARGFIDKHKLPHDKTYHYIFDGREDGWLTFRLFGYTAPDTRHIVRTTEE